MLVVAYPVAAALGFGQAGCLAAQPALLIGFSSFWSGLAGFLFGRHGILLPEQGQSWPLGSRDLHYTTFRE